MTRAIQALGATLLVLGLVGSGIGYATSASTAVRQSDSAADLHRTFECLGRTIWQVVPEGQTYSIVVSPTRSEWAWNQRLTTVAAPERRAEPNGLGDYTVAPVIGGPDAQCGEYGVLIARP